MNDPASTTAVTTDGGDATGGDSTEVVVRTLLGLSGIAPDDGEVAALVGVFPALRDGIAGLYAIDEVRYGSPGLVFDADPAFVTWA
jgi:hypothetical protein